MTQCVIFPKLRQAVAAVDVLGMSYREAARVLGIRHGTLQSRLARARARVSRRCVPSKRRLDRKGNKYHAGSVRARETLLPPASVRPPAETPSRRRIHTEQPMHNRTARIMRLARMYSSDPTAAR
jgi:hypothetical protein